MHKGIDGKNYKLRLKVPYNFDKNLIDGVKEIKERHDDIEYFFYVPCWSKDSYNTRSDRGTNIDTWEKYVDQIEYIKNAGFNFEILFQKPKQILSDDVLKRYINLGAKRFTMFEKDNAKRIKEIDPSIWTSASITQVLTPEQIETEDLSMYDEICLFFWYNRNLDTIKKLPKKYEYSIISNAPCKSVCNTHLIHWFYVETYGSHLLDCPHRQQNAFEINISRDDYLNYFTDYIQVLKITDREMPYPEILNLVLEYSGEVDPFIKLSDYRFTSHEESYFNLNHGFPKSLSINEFLELYPDVVRERSHSCNNNCNCYRVTDNGMGEY